MVRLPELPSARPRPVAAVEPVEVDSARESVAEHAQSADDEVYDTMMRRQEGAWRRTKRRLGVLATRRCPACKRFLGGRACRCGYTEGAGYGA